MTRKQLYLPQKLDKEIQIFSNKMKKSYAEMVRELLELGMKDIRYAASGKLLLNLVKKAKRGGYKDLSKYHDKYLYGHK